MFLCSSCVHILIPVLKKIKIEEIVVKDVNLLNTYVDILLVYYHL